MTLSIKSPCEGSTAHSMTGPAQACRGPWVLIATILASSMAFIDTTVVNVALPALQSALHATVSDMQWVVESYALLLASLLLLSGSLGDIYGRRKVFTIGVILFAFASAWCGASPSIASLILARGVQGVGAAFLVPGSLAIISAAYPEKERGRAIGTWSGFTAVTTAIGPVLGGWLVQHYSWRLVFFINLPIAIIVVCITLWHVPESRNDHASSKLDWPGAVLATTGLGAITYSLIEAPRSGAVAWASGVAGLAAVAAFLVVESRASAPMLSLHLFRSRDFTGANLLTFLLYAPLSGLLFFLPLDLIQVHHYSATQAGAALLPLILIIFVLSRWSGGLVARYGARRPLTIGSAVVAGGFALFLQPDLGGSYWTTFFPAVLVLGLGMAISVAPLTTAVMESVSSSEAGVASGVNNAVSRIAGLLAIALFGLVLSAGFSQSLDQGLAKLPLTASQSGSVMSQRAKLAGIETTDPQIRQSIDKAFLAGYHQVILISVGMALLSSLSARLIQPGVRPPGAKLLPSP